MRKLNLKLKAIADLQPDMRNALNGIVCRLLGKVNGKCKSAFKLDSLTG